MSTAPDVDDADAPDTRAKPPFLRRVRIRGYKSIAFCDVTLEPLTILVGRNASGKSNFLDALAFLRDAMATDVAEAVKRHGGWLSVCSQDRAIPRISFDLELQLPGAQLAQFNGWGTGPVVAGADVGPTQFDPDVTYLAVYSLAVASMAIGPVYVDYESLTFHHGKQKLACGFVYRDDTLSFELHSGRMPNGREHPLPAPRGPARRPQITAAPVNPLVSHISRLLLEMGSYNFHPDSIRRLQVPTHGSTLERNGSNLASVIETMRKNDSWVVERIGRYLSAITESVELLGAVKYGEYETVRFQVLRNGQGAPLEFDAASMSDGTLRALAALVAAFQIVPPYGSPSLVAIEEPETALHPDAMRALVDALDEATLRTQILLTTHSADLLDNPTIRPENVRVVEMIDGRTVIGPVDEASVEIVRRKLDTLGGLERQNQLAPDLDDQERQRHLSRNGPGPTP